MGAAANLAQYLLIFSVVLRRQPGYSVPAVSIWLHSQFTDHSNGTATDNKTGLMWAQCAEGLSGGGCATGGITTHTWQAALDLAAASTHAGHTDWRLPNLKELASIVEIACSSPAINATIFPNTLGAYFWSASPNANYSSYAWFVRFYNGGDSYYSRSYGNRVRLVRGGQ
ncbi:MAG: DUF1566 domain-containing protein [Pseudomonadota bacterium]|nr:DUF1566 domain-containing protein [Pseudomonadota bacterium]